MKAVILAGGYGTRISEETTIRPKPMVELGGKPILWHILKSYSHYGINDFIICCGYKSHIIKDYFTHYQYYNSDITIDLEKNSIQIDKNNSEPWKITLVETGEKSLTGGRLLRVKDYIGKETFCFTYGDGLCNVNIKDVIAFHKEHKKLATVIAVQPPGRFGVFTLKKDSAEIASFREKPKDNGSWINGGYMVLEPEAINYIENDLTTFEQQPMQQMARDGQLVAYRHDGFWQPMDTLRDKHVLEDLWKAGTAPWKVW